ncbi:MAG: hypothetical protein KC561_06500 [Myxococcales bacterium]|nr:hypothetical protein [Myxococcales bacterium]
MRGRSLWLLAYFLLLASLPSTGVAQEPSADPEGDSGSERGIAPDDPTSAGPVSTTPSSTGFAASSQIFADYTHTNPTASDSFDEFSLRRAELGVSYSAGSIFRAVTTLEAIRAAGEGSFFGVDGNSLLVRVKHAFADVDLAVGPISFEIRAGLIPEIVVEFLESGYGLRGISATAGEHFGFFDTSDLGASLGVGVLDAVFFQAQVTNGEGRNEVEQNDGKNLTLQLIGQLTALDVLGDRLRLAAGVSWRDGSLGIGSARNQRVAAGLFALHPRFGAGAEIHFADGYAGRPDRTARGIGAWGEGFALPPWLGAFVRIDRFDGDPDHATDSGQLTLTAGLYSEPLDALLDDFAPLGGTVRLYAGYRMERYGDDAEPLPGVASVADSDQFFLSLAIQLGVEP